MVERRSYVFLGLLALGVGCGGENSPVGSGGSPGSGAGGGGSSGGFAGSIAQGGAVTGSGGTGINDGVAGIGGNPGGNGGNAGGGSAGAPPGGSGGGFSVTFPGTGLNDQLHDVAIDSQGRAIVVGGVDGAFAIGANDSDGGVLVLRLDHAGDVDWGTVIGPVTGTSLTDFDTRGEGVAIGSDDSIVVVGSYRSDVVFGKKELSVVDSQQGPDAFVAKFDADGEVLWAQGYGSAGYDSATDVALDSQGNVYVTGYVTGTVDFGGGARSATSQSPFVLKLDANGNHQFSKVYPGSGSASAGSGIGVDSTGAAWVSGYFSGALDFGGDELSRTGDEYGAFLLGLSAAGEHVFSDAYGDSGYHFGFGLLVQPDGSLLMTGTAVGEIDFGGGPLGSEYSAESQGALYAAHFGPGAVHDWAELASGTGDYDGFGVAIDALGNYYVAGEVLGSDSFDPAPVLVRFDPAGNEIDQQIFDADGRFDAVVVDAAGNVYAVGWFYSSADFGFGELTGENDIAIVKLPKE